MRHACMWHATYFQCVSMSGPCYLMADEKCTKPHVQTETHFLSDPKPAKTSLEMKHDMRKTHYSRRCNRGNVTPHQPYTKTQRRLPTENVPRQNVLDRCGQQHKYKGEMRHTSFGGKVIMPISNGCARNNPHPNHLGRRSRRP
jgi:hypothetical protein